MRLGVNLGYWGTDVVNDTRFLREIEDLGYDSVWTAEAYGTDALTPLAFAAAHTTTLKVGSGILQMPARTPAMTCMSAVTLDKLSGGRFMLGLGVSGPQVVEGWHGLPYGKPLARTREYVEIVRKILARDEPVVFDGEYYQLPYSGEDATGLGKPLKMITKPEHDIPIYLASIGPKNVALTAEIADGWLPVFYSPERAAEVFGPHLDEGLAASGEPGKAARFDIAPTVGASITDNIEAGRLEAKPMLALYIGGMGARSRNFYHDLACRYGYEGAAGTIQDLYLAGKKLEATMAVPDALVDEINLIGTRAQIADRLDVWKESGATTLILNTLDRTTLRTIAELVL